MDYGAEAPARQHQVPTTHPQRVAIETGDQRIVGEVMLPSEGYRSRFSDLLNRQDTPFVPVINAEISSLHDERVDVRPFIVVGRDHIRVAYELS
jgi:hypothetical protein